jgi:hypothetical protein
LFPLFATGVVDTSGNLFTTDVVDTGGKFAVGIVDTGGKFAIGINNTSGTCGKIAADVIDTDGKLVTGVVITDCNFAAGVVDTGAILPPVSLIPVVHLDLRISPQISKKFEMAQELFSGAWGKRIHGKNLKQKISSL